MLQISSISMTSMRAPGKIVVASQHYAPDPSTTATYLTAIAEGLAADRDVLVLSGTAHSAVTPAKTDRPRVVEVGNWTTEKKALARRASAMVLFSTKMFFAILKHVTKNDVVLCVTTPFMLPYAVTLAAKLRGASATLVIHVFCSVHSI